MTDSNRKNEVQEIKTVDSPMLVQDYLSEWQKDGETPLFRLLLDEEKIRELTEKERSYLRFYQRNTHYLLASAVGLVPVYYLALRFRKELSKFPRNSAVLNRLVLGLFVTGSCTFGLLGLRVFRQHFYIHPDEGQLKTLHLSKLRKYDLDAKRRGQDTSNDGKL